MQSSRTYGMRVASVAKIATIAFAAAMAVGCTTVQTPTKGDPFESFNRTVFKFNDTVDQYALKPVAQGYVKITATGLKPNTQHYYRWRSNGALAVRARGRCKTLATPGAPTSFKFVSISCVRTAANDAYFASHLAQLDSAFTLFSGDFYYERTTQDTSLAKTFRDNWHRPHTRSRKRLQPAMAEVCQGAACSKSPMNISYRRMVSAP